MAKHRRPTPEQVVVEHAAKLGLAGLRKRQEALVKKEGYAEAERNDLIRNTFGGRLSPAETIERMQNTWPYFRQKERARQHRHRAMVALDAVLESGLPERVPTRRQRKMLAGKKPMSMAEQRCRNRYPNDSDDIIVERMRRCGNRRKRHRDPRYPAAPPCSLPSFSEWGSYPIVYYVAALEDPDQRGRHWSRSGGPVDYDDSTAEIACPDCANDQRQFRSDDGVIDSDVVEDAGRTLDCDFCHARISGEPDVDDIDDD